jgi:hypothetical protein
MKGVSNVVAVATAPATANAERVERVPFAWPRWLTTSRAATALTAISASTTTALLTAWIPAPEWSRFVLVGVGAIIATLFARWACKTDTVSRAVLRSMGAGALHAFVMGGVVVPLFVTLIQTYSEGRRSPNDGGLFFAFMIGSLIVGAPLGGAVGLGYSVVPAIAARLKSTPSHTDNDYLALSGGMWLMAVAALHWIVLMAAGGTGTSNMGVAGLLWIIPFSLGGLLLILNAIRASAISRFVDRLHDKSSPSSSEFRIVPRTEVEPKSLSGDVLPLIHGAAAEDCQEVLVRVGLPPREVLYRDPATPDTEDRVVALLP